MARSTAWAVPVVIIGTPARASAASCETPTVELVSQVGGNGYDVRLGDGKVRSPAGVNYLASGNMARIDLAVTRPGGQVVPGVSVTVASDGSAVDDEGNAMIRFAAPGSGTQGEAPGPSQVGSTTDAQGQVTVWAATATYRRQDRAVNPALDNSGTFTVSVAAEAGLCATTRTFTFQVVDVAPFAAV